MKRRPLFATATRARILTGVAIGVAAGVVTGLWGSASGLPGMIAGVITIGIIPLALHAVSKRRTDGKEGDGSDEQFPR